MIKIFSILLLLTSPVLAHDWYSQTCCGGKDCHPVSCDELIELKNGTIQYQEYNFSKAQIHPSQDSQCHVCIHEYNEMTKVSIPVCVYIQQSF